MNTKFIISSAVMAITSLMTGFLIHAVALQSAYASLPNLYRSASSQMEYMPYMLLHHLLIGIGLTWIYRRGHEAGKGVLVQGARFGAAIAVVSTIPTFLVYFAVQPMPSDVVAQQIVFSTIAMLVQGVIVAWLNKS
jgi:hypothetical protein